MSAQSYFFFFFSFHLFNAAFPTEENLSPVGGGGVNEAAFLIQKTRPQIVITFATGITSYFVIAIYNVIVQDTFVKVSA